MSPVAAPADKRFRRAHVKPGRKRRRAARVRQARVEGAGARVAGRLRAVPRRQRRRPRRRPSDRSTSSFAATAVCRTARCWPCSAGCAARTSSGATSTSWRRRLMTSPWVRDAALRRSLPSTVEVTVTERQPIGIGRISGELYLVDEPGDGDRSLRPAVRRPRSADRRRPRRPRDRRRDARPGARRSGRPADRGAAGRSGRCRDGCRRSTSPICTTRR